MKQLLIIYAMLISTNCFAQNVGIGTPTPAEKLDVNGNLNVSGDIKINGNPGSSGQVLMKDAANNTIWGDMTRFKNIIVFDCTNNAGTPGAGNCPANWTVPGGVTQVFVECWAGGGGGGSISGGGAGGYISGIITTIPAASATLTIGAAGGYGSSVVNGIIGGTSTIVISGITLNAYGGSGGRSGDIFSSTPIPPASGGAFGSSTNINILGLYGQSGHLTTVRFDQTSTTDFARIFYYGDGGDAPLYPGSGGKGGFATVGNGVNSSNYAAANSSMPGAGGGADKEGGYPGRGGRIIIRY